MKKRPGEQWGWEASLPALSGALAEGGAGPTELVLPRVQDVWVPE